MDLAELPLVDDELDLLARLVPLPGLRIIELGCGAARLARALLARHPDCRVVGLEVDARQHAKNLAAPAAGLEFAAGGAEAIPFPDAGFDLVLMLKSLHHVPVAQMDRALAEAQRVLRPGGWLYVSEPVYAGALNELARLYNDEGEVRAAALAALDRARAGSGWTPVADTGFQTPVRFVDYADYERRTISDVTFAERRIDDATRAELRRRFEAHLGADGARFTRPMRVQLLRKRLA